MGLKIKDRGLTKILKAFSNVGLVAKVGIQGAEAAQDHDGITNVALGVVHEFGSPAENIPSRSFMRSTMDEQREKYFRIMLQGVRTITDSRGRVDAKRALGVLAEVMSADVKKKIRSNIPPSLSPKYAARRMKKGTGTRTLVVSGALLNSITPVVVKK